MASLPDHPEAQLENDMLARTLELIGREHAFALMEREKSLESLEAARAGDPEQVPVREMLYAASGETLRYLELARRSPYFTRVDFLPAGGKSETHYIGRTGVLNTKTLKSAVIDWRAPIANLYYSGQIGSVSYEAPDGRVEGELKLKRQLSIKEGELESIFDTDLASRDEYLQSVLGAMTEGRLKEIVTTIQAEQNYVIRYPLNRSLIVQGVAGSGKTTIALHRIAYLLYAFRKQLSPAQVLILAPNPLFLGFIQGVLPDLGVERVKQSTFLRLIGEWLGKKLPPVAGEDRTERICEMSAGAYERLKRIHQAKGSLGMDAALQRWLDEYETDFALNSIDFGPIRLYTKEDLSRFLLVDEKPFPMERRLLEFKKQLTARAKAAVRQMTAWMETEFDKRLGQLIAGERDPDVLAARRAALVASREKRVQEAKEEVAPFVKRTLAAMPTLEPAACYELFLKWLLVHEQGALREAAEYTLERIEGKAGLEPEDTAPIAAIAQRLNVLERLSFKHIVVDEAQDFSLMEFKLLKRISPMASMTVVGDLMQGVQGYRGLGNWRELSDGVFEGRAALHHLLTSYRSTVEIMDVALKVASRHPAPGQKGARPVLRHGKEPEFGLFTTESEQVARVCTIVSQWKSEGMASIAVVGRGASGIKRLKSFMPEALGAKLLDVESGTFEPGVLLATASAVKGFEFDAVLVLDAGEDQFPDDAQGARLLYVALTRALHRLAVLYHDARSPLFEGRGETRGADALQN